MSDLRLSRRHFSFLAGAGLVAAALPRPVHALTVQRARTLIDQVVADILQVINSGRAEARMYQDFERILVRYADMPAIARSVLGPMARGASASQLSAFQQAFQGYISRKYGRRFREFIGGRIEVTGAQPLGQYFEVVSTVYLQGEAPFELRWRVADRSGQDRFFDLVIEGVSLLISERQEIGALLDQRGQNLNRLINDLNAMG